MTIISDPKGSPVSWNSWQAMRFLYEDVNSLLMGGSLDLSTFNLPALHLPNYFNSFSTIQGAGSTNVGTGPPNQSGGGSGGGTAIVLPCSIKELAYKPLLEFRDYILTFGDFALKTVVAEIEAAMTSATHMVLGFPDVIKVGNISKIQFSVDVCRPPSCSTITDLSLIFHAQSSVYVAGVSNPASTVTQIDYFFSLGYDFKASYGAGNIFTRSVNPGTDDPPRITNGYSITGSGFQNGAMAQTNSDTVFSLMADTFQNIISPQIGTDPGLQNKFKELLTLANCQ